jgi:hypothetical protein
MWIEVPIGLPFRSQNGYITEEVDLGIHEMMILKCITNKKCVKWTRLAHDCVK